VTDQEIHAAGSPPAAVPFADHPGRASLVNRMAARGQGLSIAVTAADDVVVLDGILGPSADDLFETTLA